uniref:Odorant receptor n=1 Tax=Adelphocoris lineolatus TaxID=236346 RepID=A0A2I4PH74_ADELI|nr:olfactory receptor 79 [Adelphocoris lineolatus]
MSGIGRIGDDEIVNGLDIWYLKCSGLWDVFNDYRDSGARNKLFRIWMVITVMFFAPLAFLSTFGPFFVEADLEGLTLIILNPMSCSQTVIKFAVLWYGIETQCKLLDLFKNDFLTCVPPDKKLKASRILTASAKKANILAYLGIFMDAATVAVWNILPILRSEFFRVQLGITAFGTPMKHNKILGFWYPVDYDVAPYVQFVYCYEFFTCFWAGFIIALLEGLIVQLILLLTANIRVLQYLLEEIKASNSNLNSETLLLYAKEYQKLLVVGDDMRHLYNSLITMQLSTGLIILIITIFNFFLSSGNGDIVIMFKFVIYLMYTLVEVALYCYVGSDLETTGDEIGFATYCSEWYKVGVKFRKTLQMMMVRSRYSMAIKFGRLYPVNLMALTNILQMAYSTSMLLYRITNKEEENRV